MVATDLGFTHRFVPATESGRPPLLLLHGSGGDESDLLDLGRQLSPGAALLSPRGKVLENGMPRFFQRLAEGVFDLEDLAVRTRELGEFADRAREHYRIEKPVAVGFSNGANIAVSLLLTRPEVLAGAVLMRAMVPFVPRTLPMLDGFPVLLLSGAGDPIVPADHRDRLAKLFSDANAAVTYKVMPAGHNLTPQDIAIAARWLGERG
jgi:phospholipase/carboxylesterase